MTRDKFINVRFNPEEVSIIDQFRQSINVSRSAYIRSVAIGKPPKVIPEINRAQWVSLSHIGANLNQIAHDLNAGQHGDTEYTMQMIREAIHLLSDVRKALLGEL